MSRRPTIPEAVALALMVANRHTCCFCRTERKHVIIHHTDGDPSNNDPINLVVLCHDCHSRVEGNEGLGRQFSTAEVRAYKTQWETLCAAVGVTEEEVEDDPTPILYQAFRLDENEHQAFDLIDLEEDDELQVEVSADRYIDASICTGSHYKEWLRGHDLMEFEGADDAREFSLNFIVPRPGDYVLLLINRNRKRRVDVEVEAVILP
jgi:hypothetical protein